MTVLASTPFTETSIPIRRILKSDAIEQIRVWIESREHQYGLSSEQMLLAVQNAEIEESQEITSWAFWYRTLQTLTS